MLRRLLLLAILVLGGAWALGTGPAQPREGRVLRIVDGDTLHVRLDGRDETVRIVGIDTPEVGDCGAGAATAALRDLVAGRRVRVVRDRSQSRRDRYGRLLGYVEAGGVDAGARLVRDGWADLYVFADDPFDRVGAYRRAFGQARAAGRGVHARCPGAF